mgnify:CR=1 FL=1
MDSIIGRTILGYKVIERIGAGGFGDVYKVERNNIIGNVTRALKVITLPRDNEYIEILNSMGGDREKADTYFHKELDRVVNEIRVFSMISEKDNHHIVSYYESDVEKVGEYKYNIYILMEFLTPIDKWMQNNNITVENALDIGIGVADALDICHKNGIIHRDIKLSNIFVSKDGVFKIGDFGVSKNINNATMAKTIKGTPNYIAPEVYIGKNKYDSSVDNYSLGILLYYFNKLRFPYYPNFPNEYTQEDSDKAFYKRMNYEKLEAPVCAPLSVANIIKKAISERTKRYSSAKDLSKDLLEAKSNLTQKELETKIGFEPRAAVDEWVENDKERRLVQDLNGDGESTVSFIEQGITVFEKREEDKTGNLQKRKIIIAASVCVICIIVVALFAGKMFSDRQNNGKSSATAETSEQANESKSEALKENEESAMDALNANQSQQDENLNSESGANQVEPNQNSEPEAGQINNNQNPENVTVVETTKKAKKKKQQQTTKAHVQETTSAPKQNNVTQKPTQKPIQKPTQKPTQKKDEDFDFKSVVE